MRPITRIAFGSLLIALGALLGGCSINNRTESGIPWNKPADWEGQIPGMGQNGMPH
jgi:hypothetical protein